MNSACKVGGWLLILIVGVPMLNKGYVMHVTFFYVCLRQCFPSLVLSLQLPSIVFPESSHYYFLG
jgi:hypothetical protein